MRKTALRMIPLILLLSVALSACSGVPMMEYKDGLYTNGDTGVAYRVASANYEAKSILSEDVLAMLGRDDVEGNLIYAIPNMDASQYMASADYELYYAGNITLPTLRKMNPYRVLFTQTKVITASLVQIEEAQVLADIVAAYDGKAFPFEEIIVEGDDRPTLDYRMKFESREYTGFYYTLDYYSYESDVTVWELIEDANDFEILYPNAEVSTVEEGGYLYAVYNFGTDILYDHVTRMCYPLGDTLSEYRDQLADSDMGSDS